MNKTSFIDKHPNLTSVVGVIVWFAVIALMAVFTGCKPTERIVEVVKTDTLVVNQIQRDSVYVEKELHDSVFIHQKGDTVMIEKFRTEYRDRWRDRYIHDSIYIAKHDTITQTVVKEVAKKENFFTKLWRKIQVPFTIVGVVAVVMMILWLVMKLKR